MVVNGVKADSDKISVYWEAKRVSRGLYVDESRKQIETP